MEDIMLKLFLFYEQMTSQSEELEEISNEFSKEQRIFMGQLKDKDAEDYKKLANIHINMSSIAERENFANGMKFGAKLIFELLVG